MSAPLPQYRPIEYFPPPLAGRHPERRWKYAVLLVLTFVTTTLMGGCHYALFSMNFDPRPLAFPLPLQDYLNGLWYSVPLLAILGAHELGHYYACRYYGVDASLPYFLPAPPPILTGTLGAFIRIRQRIRNKRQLFDIGIAGPIAGFLVAVPVLLIGLKLSRLVRTPADMSGAYELGEPLLFQLFAWMTWGSPPDGYSLNMHPTAFAAWFGLLATLLNLFPIGQLDGGHISYAVLGRRSTVLSVITVIGLIGLTFVSLSWLLWTVVTMTMLFLFGVHHPHTLDEDVPLDRRRMMLAGFAVVMFVLCFMSAPAEPIELVSGGR